MLKEIRKENRIMSYVRETRAELRKVVWPTREEATNLTLIVVSTIVAMSVFFGAIDYVLSALVRFLFTQ
ncbi:MAG: preprotein translocase subunit SecE [Chloroflexi bacterium]|nr:preprotein translocase subunit SecE [Chloroflexota bacterium]